MSAKFASGDFSSNQFPFAYIVISAFTTSCCDRIVATRADVTACSTTSSPSKTISIRASSRRSPVAQSIRHSFTELGCCWRWCWRSARRMYNLHEWPRRLRHLHLVRPRFWGFCSLDHSLIKLRHKCRISVVTCACASIVRVSSGNGRVIVPSAARPLPTSSEFTNLDCLIRIRQFVDCI